MSALLNASIDLDTTDCCVCGVMFAMPKHMLQKLRDSGNGFYCPNGHSLAYNESTVKRLQRELDDERLRKSQALARANEQQARADKAEKALKRHKTRAKNGVCPCCNRTFKELARHIATKHPEYGKT